MTVVHIAFVPLPPDYPDASRLHRHPGRWVIEIAKAQMEYGGVEPILVSPVPGGSAVWSGRIEGMAAHFVPVPRRVRAATFFYLDSRRLAAYVRALHPALVHSHGTEDSTTLAATRTGLPFVVTFQGVQALMNRTDPAPLLSRRTLQWMAERIALRRTRFGVAKSRYGAREMSMLCPWIRLFEIPNTYTKPKLETPTKRVPATLAYAGSLTTRKGLETLVGALAELKTQYPELRLVLLGGNVKTPYSVGIVHQLRSVLGDGLIVKGIVPRLELESALASARALVAPSLEEMFGNQVIDALMVGTPVVVSSETPMAENVERFGNGTVFARGNASSLRDALGRTLSTPYDPVPAREAVERIEDYMGPERVGRLHGEAYRTVLEQWGGNNV
jgi:glycosyltransferase involved in cell wall biosynthesis